MTATLRLRTDQLAKYRAVAGVDTDTELAQRMGFDPTTVWRVLTGRTAPSARFIAALPAAFKGLGLDDLWEVVVAGGDEGGQTA